MKIVLSILILIISIQSCHLNKDKTPEKSLQLASVDLQKINPGIQSTDPFYRIVFRMNIANDISSLDSALYNSNMITINSIAPVEYEMILPNNKKITPFKLFYTSGGIKYYTYVKKIGDKETENRP
jgi:hypothetical protein